MSQKSKLVDLTYNKILVDFDKLNKLKTLSESYKNAIQFLIFWYEMKEDYFKCEKLKNILNYYNI